MAESNGKKKVLITGGAGLIGGILVDHVSAIATTFHHLDLKEAARCSIARSITR